MENINNISNIKTFAFLRHIHRNDLWGDVCHWYCGYICIRKDIYLALTKECRDEMYNVDDETSIAHYSLPYIHGGVTFANVIRNKRWNIIPLTDIPFDGDYAVVGFDCNHCDDTAEEYNFDKVSAMTNTWREEINKLIKESEL